MIGLTVTILGGVGVGVGVAVVVVNGVDWGAGSENYNCPDPATDRKIRAFLSRSDVTLGIWLLLCSAA